MDFIDAQRIAGLLTPATLVEALRQSFRAAIEVPVRHHHTIPRRAGERATLLLMPAWHALGEETAQGAYIGIKIATVFPENARRNAASVEASYLLLDGETGRPLAVMDGRAITLWRTAAASALAADYLAKKDATRLVMVGAGALAPYLIKAHASVRPIAEVVIWNRDAAKAEALARTLAGPVDGRSLRITATGDLRQAIAQADIVSAATLSHDPIVKGAWLAPGAHVDLVGGFTPQMREADDEAVRRAAVFVDTRAGALKEAGDLVQPLKTGVIAEADVKADLSELCRGVHGGRQAADEITLFKSVGTALEDLAAAALVYQHLGDKATRNAPPVAPRE
jgi:ornithine cyclodeaminase